MKITVPCNKVPGRLEDELHPTAFVVNFDLMTERPFLSAKKALLPLSFSKAYTWAHSPPESQLPTAENPLLVEDFEHFLIVSADPFFSETDLLSFVVRSLLQGLVRKACFVWIALVRWYDWHVCAHLLSVRRPPCSIFLLSHLAGRFRSHVYLARNVRTRNIRVKLLFQSRTTIRIYAPRVRQVQFLNCTLSHISSDEQRAQIISWKLKSGCASIPVHGFHESHGAIIVSAVFCSCLALAVHLVLSASSSSLLAPPSGNFGPWSTKTLSDSVEKNGWNIQWRWKNTSWKMHRIMIEIDILLFFMDRYFVVFFVARWVPKIPLTC